MNSRHLYLFQDTCFRIHCCFPKLFRIHFTQTFVSLSVYSLFASVTVFLDESMSRFFSVAIFANLTLCTFVQWRSSYIQVTFLNELYTGDLLE